MTAFREWRRDRPFWGGLLLVLSGLEMFLSANMSLDNIEIHIGPQGFLSYLIPTIMLISGALVWFSPAQRLFYGVIGTLTALYSFIGLNLGGWILGMILGIVGGALVIAWTAPPQSPAPTPDSGEPTAEFPPVVSDPAIVPGLDDQDPSRYAGEPRDPAHPGFAEPDPDGQAGDPGPRHRSMRRKALILIAPLLLGAAVIGGGNMPADAAPECPKGMPSRTATPSADAAAKKKAAAAKREKKAQASASTSASASASKAQPKASPSPSPSAGAGDAEESDTPILDGINDIIEGINDGLNDIFNPGPSPTPTSAAPTSTGPTSPGPTSAAPAPAPSTTSAGPSTAPSAVPSGRPSAAPAASAKPEEIPCLGPRQVGLLADADGIPRAGVKPGILKTASLTMYNSTYEGVVDVPTANGPIKSLFFSMDKAVNKPFSLAIAEPNGKTTLIKSGQLTTDGNVEFYSPKFQGKLFGLIPVTFTPEQPPPLTLPVLWFTDVTIDLAYVQCDVLTAKPISITEV
ncbi:hypothetical protein ACTI_72970 [Actinoplanes sp. OR16]|uniref:DUF6114 domain-containing protein n=1 Tax=Actinoplanes sp. OR16 TaxID=946334 RepID=UPI000F6FB4C5|nr:DUF6114 domain-containing protein [Actinoplanes sp. OR16]BBH70612.1 hypothetical protein ACTI_72970 [Actinoplanes sp. OR16]